MVQSPFQSWDWAKAMSALIPLLIGSLVTVAWQNSNTMNLIVLRQDRADEESRHLRELIEKRLVDCK